MLLEALTKANMRQSELCDSIHISRTTLCEVIAGRYSLSDEKAFKIERHLPQFNSEEALCAQVRYKRKEYMLKYGKISFYQF
jgi:plasmid maintenance system antidote protein VapI